MGSLRHVMLSWPDPSRLSIPNQNVGKHLVNLQTLQGVSAGSWIKEESLGKMTNLTSLGIHGITPSHHRALSKSLDRLLLLCRLTLEGDDLPRKVLALPGHLHLEILAVVGQVLTTDDLDAPERIYGGSDLPPNLNHMILQNTQLQQDPLMLLGTLTSWLRRLELYSNAYAGEEVVCSAGGFPQLEHLSIEDLPHLRRWKVEDGAMPRLNYLEINDCKQLEALPDGLRYLKALQELVINYMPDDFYRRLDKDGGEDWPKIQHVPVVQISHW